MKQYRSSSNRPKPTVILWDRGDISGWNLSLVLQMAGCRVHTVNSLAEGLNLARMASETEQAFACMIGRAQYLVEEETRTFLDNLSDCPLPLPFVVLKAHAEEPVDVAGLRSRYSKSVQLCSPLTLLDTVGPLLDARRREAV